MFELTAALIAIGIAYLALRLSDQPGKYDQ